jgi:hypothetical protein
MQFIASYPKSGNTWVRLVAAAYAFEELEPSDFATFDAGDGKLAKHLWDDRNLHHYQSTTPFALKDVDFSVEVRLRPAAMMVLARDVSKAPGRDFLLVDSHHANCSVNGMNLWNQQWTDRVVNLVRDPREICCSLSSHLGLSYEETAAFMADSEAQFPLEHDSDADEAEADDAEEEAGDDVPLHHLLLSWSDHTRSWFESDGLSVLSVRYEDMVADPVAVFQGIFEFLDVPDLTDEKVEAAVETVEFDRMREAEEEHGFPKASEEQEHFFRSGQADGWKDELPTEVAHKIEEDHGEMMEALGYL